MDQGLVIVAGESHVSDEVIKDRPSLRLARLFVAMGLYLQRSGVVTPSMAITPSTVMIDQVPPMPRARPRCRSADIRRRARDAGENPKPR